MNTILDNRPIWGRRLRIEGIFNFKFSICIVEDESLGI